MRAVSLINNTQTDLSYPRLPPVPQTASEDLKKFHASLVIWYDDLIRLLRKDRDETLAKINNLS